MSLKDFLKECNTRGIFKMLSIYIVSSWVILQVLSLISQPLGMSDKSVTYAIILLLIGFPVYILYLWKSRVRHTKSTANNSFEETIFKEVSFKRKYFITLGVISLISFAAVAVIINTNFSDKISLVKLTESNKIAVLNFDNNSNDPSLDFVGEMAADWLIYGISENQAGEVISSDVVKNYSNMLGVQMSPDETKSIFNKFLNPSKVVSGSIFLKDSTLIVQCSIKDGMGNKTFITFPQVRCDVDSPLDCIEVLRQKVVSYLVIKDESKISLEETPPKFKAYQKVLEAKSKYDKPNEYFRLLNEAVAIDPDYFEPKGLIIQHYYNQRDSKTSDSLIKDLAAEIKISKKQRNFINFLEALIEGKHNKTFRYHQFEYNEMPFDLTTNSTQITLATQHINRPDLVEDMFNAIQMDGMILEKCFFCKERYFGMAMAYNDLGDYKKAIDLLEPVVFDAEDIYLYRALISAYIKSGNVKSLNDFLSKLALSMDENDLLGLYLYAGKRFLLVDNKQMADSSFNNLINSDNSDISDLANAYYYKEDYVNAEKVMSELYTNNPNNSDIIAKLAVSLYNNGKQEKAKELINTLSDLRDDYQYGRIDYSYAIYLASTGQNQSAITHLMESVAQGNYYLPGSFHNDPHFLSIKGSPEFQKVLTYWH